MFGRKLELGIASKSGQFFGLLDKLTQCGSSLPRVARHHHLAESRLRHQRPDSSASSASSSDGRLARVPQAATAAEGLDAAQRRSASVPQKFRRCRRASPSAPSTTAEQWDSSRSKICSHAPLSL